jgi:hypothetical protein
VFLKLDRLAARKDFKSLLEVCKGCEDLRAHLLKLLIDLHLAFVVLNTQKSLRSKAASWSLDSLQHLWIRVHELLARRVARRRKI